MTWFHIDGSTGDIVCCSDDSDFSESKCSEEMGKHFVNVHSDMTISEARAFKGPKLDSEGNVVSKYSHKVDLDSLVPDENREKAADRECCCPFVHGNLTKDEITRK